MLLALDCQSLGEILGRMADDHCRISSLTIYPLERGFFHFGNQMYFLIFFFMEIMTPTHHLKEIY